MGRVKREMERLQEQGYADIEKVVCQECLSDSFLRAEVQRSGELGTCSYCQSERSVMQMNSVMDLVVDGIEAEWSDADRLGLYWEGEYQVETFSNEELLSQMDEVSHVDEVSGDIAESLTERPWCAATGWWAVSTSERLIYAWEFLEYHVKHERRYFFSQGVENDADPDALTVAEMLEAVGDSLETCGLFRVLPVGTPIYRARVQTSPAPVELAKELGTVPVDCAIQASRMSPPGIAMFYGSFDAETAIGETYEPSDVTCYSSLGRFTACRELRVLDLTNLPSFPSLYDGELRDRRPVLRFLRWFAGRVSMSICRDSRVHLEYVPTQVVTEYLRAMNTGSLDGILYSSSKVEGGTCITLFVANQECVDELAHDGSDAALLLEGCEHQELPASAGA